MPDQIAPSENDLREALKKVIDPELGMDIISLGLVYGISVAADKVLVDLTMTSPACPMGDMIMEDAETVLRDLLPPSFEVEVRLVWEPPWEPSMMTEKARGHFNW